MKDNKTKGFVETAKSLLGATPMGARASQQCEAQTDNYRPAYGGIQNPAYSFLFKSITKQTTSHARLFVLLK